jgi:hypothetical protein
MSPFKGQGANVTLLDATSLVDSLYSSKSLAEAKSNFQKEMKSRARVKVLESRRRVSEFHTNVVLSEDYIKSTGGLDFDKIMSLWDKDIGSHTPDLETAVRNNYTTN